MVIDNINIINKAIELDNSELFDIHKWSDYPEVNSLVDKLFLELSSDLTLVKGNLKIRKKHLKTLVLDLYVKYLKDPAMYVSVYLAKWYYDNLESRYNKLHISKLTPIIIHALHDKGYIDLVLGHYSRESNRASHITRIRAKPSLIELIIRENVKAEMIERHPLTETIILRTFDEEKGKLEVAYEDTDETKIWRSNLVAYNNLLRRTYVDVIGAPSDGIRCRQSEKSKSKGQPPKKIHITQHAKFVRRVFNNGTWNDGGRFYGGWWQRISEKWRAQIRIWNSPVTEIDYKSLHIHLLYRQKNIEFNGDPYLLKSYPKYNGDRDMRTFLKLVLLCTINAIEKTKAIQAINKEINFNSDEFGWVAEDKLDLGELIDAFVKEHSALEDDFFSGKGVQLQKLDSVIAEKIINHFTAKDIPVLCVHDSFVIAVDKADELKMIMEKSYVEALVELGLNKGIEPSTDSSGIDLGLFKHMLINPQWHELKESFLNERFDYPDWTNRMEKFKALNLEPDYYC